MKKKVVITGASSSIIDAVINLIEPKKNFEIVGITRKVRQGFRQDIKWVECDLAGEDVDYSFLDNTDIVIHAAAVSKGYTRQAYLEFNFQTTKVLIDKANQYGVKRFVYISSVLACKTCGDYGYSKYIAEEYIKANFTNWLIIRPAQLYGYSEEAPIDSLINKIASKRVIPCPVGDPKGLIPLYYLDAALLIYQLVFEEEIITAIKTITGPQAFNYKGLVYEIANAIDKNITIFPILKIVLTILRYFIVITNARIGVYPDQIFRLYNPDKNLIPNSSEITYLSEYVRKNYKIICEIRK
jgi:nucleoside-diphosphate-sugar epimerase